MSKQVLFIQGGGAGVHDEFDNELVESLARELGPAYEISYPRMPDEADPTMRLEGGARAAVVRRLGGRNHQLDDDLAEVAADVRTLCH